MERDWESLFTNWAKPPSVSERERMENAERAVRDAIGASSALSDHNIRVFPQGSYRNRTNVRQDSDVDICVLCTDTYYFQLPEGKTRDQFGLNTPATYPDATFRSDVENSLIDHFGASSVHAGKKAFDVHANSYRVDADVTACFEYRFFYEDGTYRTGTALLPKEGMYIPNYPDQHYKNGYAKHESTSQQYRKIVRALKNLAGNMAASGISIANSAPSFLLESMTWNVPDSMFVGDSYKSDMRRILAHTFNATLNDEDCSDWYEVNGHKYLFRTTQPWSREQAHNFLSSAWNYVGYE